MNTFLSKKLCCNSIALLFLSLLLFACKSDDSKDIEPSKEEASSLSPEINSISPTSGAIGTPVTITGKGFSEVSANNEVRFNDVEANEITFSSAQQISTIVPENATDGPITVLVNGKKAIGPDFSVEVPLELHTITGLSAKSGLEGSTLTIVGTNFSNNDTEVSFNGRPTNAILTISATEISVTVPPGAISGPISVTIASQTVTGPHFEIETPMNYKIAFIGDSGINTDAKAVLNLIKNEGAHAIVHSGDLNYAEVPIDFETHINGILGEDFPYLYCVGNHDDTVWLGANGYQKFLENRFNRIGIPWEGNAGVNSMFYYQGIFFVSSAPDEFGITPDDAGSYIKNALESTKAKWRISYWHKNQRLMQIGGKSDEAGWNVYEESRKGGAIIATAHEHSYCRTYEMSNFQTQIISSTENTVNLIKDDLSTASVDEGCSFGFVSGLGGKSIRDAESGLDSNPWWADTFSSTNGGQHGALFGEFNYNGDATLARFYFKDIDGVVRDIFFVRSKIPKM